jgi:hypothetical protein
MTTDGYSDRDTFTFGPYAWDVTAALAVAALLGVPERPFLVESALQLLPFVHVDRDHAAGVDLAEPLLAVPFRPVRSPLVIDGWHRIWRAHRDGVAELPCRLLTGPQEFKVRLYGGDKGQPDRAARRARLLEERGER